MKNNSSEKTSELYKNDENIDIMLNHSESGNCKLNKLNLFIF